MRRATVLSTTDPENGQTTYTYERGLLGIGATNPNPATRTEPLGHVTRYAYDASGRLTKETDRWATTPRMSTTPTGTA